MFSPKIFGGTFFKAASAAAATAGAYVAGEKGKEEQQRLLEEARIRNPGCDVRLVQKTTGFAETTHITQELVVTPRRNSSLLSPLAGPTPGTPPDSAFVFSPK